jgi:hypothetical protein
LPFRGFNVSQQRITQRFGVAQPAIDALQFDNASLVFFRRVVALVEMLEFVTAVVEAFEQKKMVNRES